MTQEQIDNIGPQITARKGTPKMTVTEALPRGFYGADLYDKNG